MTTTLPLAARDFIDECLLTSTEMWLRRAATAERLAENLSEADRDVLMSYADECRAKAAA